MRKVVFSPRTDRLIYQHAKATPEYWEGVWRAEGKAAPASENDEVVQITGRHLPKGSSILEGGCGRADKVHTLKLAGYRSVGVDFAADAVRQARIDYPESDVRQGDVRALDFPDASFDGYWSIGVIEHFWDGYDQILSEAARVVRPGGVLFLTAPRFSPMRRRKARTGGYPRVDFATEPDDFYQFALPRDDVSKRLAAVGFDVERWVGTACEISLREDVASLQGPVEWLFGSRGPFPKRVLRRLVTRALDPFCGHSFLAIARRRAAR